MLLTHFYLKENKTRQGKQVCSPPFESFVVFSSKCVASRNQKKLVEKQCTGPAINQSFYTQVRTTTKHKKKSGISAEVLPSSCLKTHQIIQPSPSFRIFKHSKDVIKTQLVVLIIFIPYV